MPNSRTTRSLDVDPSFARNSSFACRVHQQRWVLLALQWPTLAGQSRCETRQYVGDELLILELLTCRCHIIRKGLHLAKVVRLRGVALLRRGESKARGDRLGTGLGGKDVVDGHPCITRRLDRNDLDEDLP